MSLPETDLHRIERWCRARVPRHLWNEVKVEADLGPDYVTIVEVRQPWDGEGDPTRMPIARLYFSERTGLWTIYSRDRNLEFHQYSRKPPNRYVQLLLEYIGSGADPIFFG